MKKETQKIYHLYHHQPDPLSADAVNEQAWLVNNGVHYSVVATIQARSPEEASQAVREKRAGHGKLTRFVTVRTGNLLRDTVPGDVLVSDDAAWIISPDAQLQRIPYAISRPWKSYAHTDTVKGISWAPNGKQLAAISRDVSLHSLFQDNDRAPTYHRHRDATGTAVAWSPDGTHIASGSSSGEVHIWTPDPFGTYRNAARGSILLCRTQERENWDQKITSMAWSPDSQRIFAGRSDGAIVQWHAITGECLDLCKRHHNDVNVLAYAPDKIHMASASDDATLRVWEMDQPPLHDLICQHAGPVSAFAWSPDGALLVSTEKEEQSLHFWDALSGTPGERIPLSISSTNLRCILTLAWSPDGRYIAAGCDDGTLQIVDVFQRRHVLTYRVGSDQRQIRSVAWSPDGTTIASGGTNQWNSGGQVRLWHGVVNGEILRNEPPSESFETVS